MRSIKRTRIEEGNGMSGMAVTLTDLIELILDEKFEK